MDPDLTRDPCPPEPFGEYECAFLAVCDAHATSNCVEHLSKAIVARMNIACNLKISTTAKELCRCEYLPRPTNRK